MCFFFFELRNPNIILAKFQLKDTPHVFWKYLFFPREVHRTQNDSKFMWSILTRQILPFLTFYFINKTCILQIFFKNKNMSEKFELSQPQQQLALCANSDHECYRQPSTVLSTLKTQTSFIYHYMPLINFFYEIFYSNFLD